MSPDALPSLFRKFRRILQLNSRVLALMADMERAMGGEYVFDRAFLQSSVRDMATMVHQVVYSLNALSGDAYLSLYDRYQTIKTALDDVVAGGLGPLAGRMALAAGELGVETEPLAGRGVVALAELRRLLDLPVVDGFVVTATGCAAIREQEGLEQAGWREQPVPERVAKALVRELAALAERRGGVALLTLSVVPAGSAISEDLAEPVLTLPAVDPEELPEALVRGLAAWLDVHAGAAADTPLAVAVHETPAAVLGGLVATRARQSMADQTEALEIRVVPEGDHASAERYLLGRSHPAALLLSEIHPKPVRQTLMGGDALHFEASGMRRGSGLLALVRLRELASMAAAAERALGRPLELDWAMAADGKLAVTAVRSLACASEPDPDELAEAASGATILLHGGEAAQVGLAAGRVAHVDEDHATDVPDGSVLVARTASPRLSPALRRAAALVTEVGATAGHLAAIARELRVPAIFGAKGALEMLPEGAEVTVDAAEATVYAGIVAPLLRLQDTCADLGPDDPEFAVLRRLLRLILPLNLVDPESPRFTSEGCQTFHDVIHFAHEMAVEELLALHDQRKDRHDGLAGLVARPLELDAPLEIRVLDIGGGLVESPGEPSDGPVRPDEVLSVPLAAFLRGARHAEAWHQRSGNLELRDVLAGVGRSLQALSAPPEYAGPNLAIVASGYVNLSLRMGYHFSVIDAFVGDNPGQNYIYFRFAGGFAEERRRLRRAELVRRVLEHLDFKTAVSGDLITGKLKIIEADQAEEVLARLGELTGFTRQLDTAMAADADIDALTRAFLDLHRSEVSA